MARNARCRISVSWLEGPVGACVQSHQSTPQLPHQAAATLGQSVPEGRLLMNSVQLVPVTADSEGPVQRLLHCVNCQHLQLKDLVCKFLQPGLDPHSCTWSKPMGSSKPHSGDCKAGQCHRPPHQLLFQDLTGHISSSLLLLPSVLFRRALFCWNSILDTVALALNNKNQFWPLQNLTAIFSFRKPRHKHRTWWQTRCIC